MQLEMEAGMTAPENNLKTVLITGASTGIGFEFARQYAVRDWRVIATHRGAVPASLAQLAAEYPAVRPARMDVTRAAQVDALAQELRDVPIDLLINNAGITHDGDGASERQNIGGYDFGLMEAIHATNLRGPLLVTQAFAGNLEQGRGKTLVTISSAHGSLTDPPATLEELQGVFYCSSKAALNRAMQVLGSVLAPRGIRTLVLNPGAVWTERYESYVAENGDAWPKEMFIMPEVSVAGMIASIDGVGAAGPARFLDHDGNEHAW
jgi:NAD(P)-dependent dehydrogenase (short-subunit alcohol dehydrogenase family)